MIKTKLFTENDGYVAEVEQPAWVTGPAPVLIWGQRVFKFTEQDKEGYVYHEVFCYYVPPPIEA